MTPDDNQVSEIVAFPKPRSGFVRWISVVTLGCSLGLLLVFIVMSARVIKPGARTGVRVIDNGRLNEAPFGLSEQPVEKELTKVIESQLAAFRNDDYTQAYAFAATALKAHVPLPVFERMVKRGYPLIAQSRSAQFGVIVDNGEQALVNATIYSESGRAAHFQYILLHEPTGWKITGVTEVKSKGTTI
jgi:hypothetical protein